MAEVARIAAEAFGVAGIVGDRPAPEVGRVGDIAQRALEDGQRLFGRADDIGGAAGARRVLQGVAWPALGRVHADAQRIVRHAAADQADAGLQCFGAGLAGKLPVGGQRGRCGADGFGHDRAGRLDGVGVAFAADPDRGDALRIDARACQRVAGRLHAHGGRVLVETRHGLFAYRASAVAVGPDTADLGARQPVAWHIGAIADDADRSTWLV